MIQLHTGDNLEYTQTLPANHINLIYGDILYATGKKFKDYQDLKPIKEIVYAHYVPRLKEMHRILSETGTIYLQMDIRINHWIRDIMDDIFGYNNFRNEIVVKYNLGGRGKKEFAKKHDVIEVYTKSDIFTFNDLDIRIPYKSVISKKQDRPNITAVKLDNGKVYVGKRHGDCYKQIKSMGISLEDCRGSKQGFITDELVFLNREQGYYHAYENNQCEQQLPFEANFCEGLQSPIEDWKACLFSEDLW